MVHSQFMDEQEMMRRAVQAWKEAGPQLEAIRHREVKEADNLQVLALLESAFNHALRSRPARESSGLVECRSGSLSSADDRSLRGGAATAGFLRPARLAILLHRRSSCPKMGRTASDAGCGSYVLAGFRPEGYRDAEGVVIRH